MTCREKVANLEECLENRAHSELCHHINKIIDNIKNL
jgi:hypothetical protein